MTLLPNQAALQIAANARCAALSDQGELITDWRKPCMEGRMNYRYTYFPCLCGRVYCIEEIHDYIWCIDCPRRYDIEWKLNEAYEWRCRIRLITPHHDETEETIQP